MKHGKSSVQTPTLLELDHLPEGVQLWDYSGTIVIAAPKMNEIRFKTIRDGLPGKLRQHVAGWRVLGAN
ncbi:MAG: hypothetical protein VB050_08170 [Geobacteraceae bacterium]|nr:hypothetical protein [Geobacteraceae bacterium]